MSLAAPTQLPGFRPEASVLDLTLSGPSLGNAEIEFGVVARDQDCWPGATWDCDESGKPTPPRVTQGLPQPPTWLIGGAVDCGVDPAARANRHADLAQHRLAGETLWFGRSGWTPDRLRLNNPALHTVVSGVPLPVVSAVATLVGSARLCGNGGPGMLHMSPQVAIEFMAACPDLVEFRAWSDAVVRPTLRFTGDALIAAVGYDGSAPNATGGPSAPGTWVYWTPPVYRWLGPWVELNANTSGGINPDTNERVFRRERQVVFAWNNCCPVLAVEVAL